MFCTYKQQELLLTLQLQQQQQSPRFAVTGALQTHSHRFSGWNTLPGNGLCRSKLHKIKWSFIAHHNQCRDLALLKIGLLCPTGAVQNATVSVTLPCSLGVDAFYSFISHNYILAIFPSFGQSSWLSDNSCRPCSSCGTIRCVTQTGSSQVWKPRSCLTRIRAGAGSERADSKRDAGRQSLLELSKASCS